MLSQSKHGPLGFGGALPGPRRKPIPLRRLHHPSLLSAFAFLLLTVCTPVVAQRPAATAGPELVIIDTDIGDDIEDVFAVGLALVSPEVRILGMMSSWDDTPLKARLLDRLLCETGRTDIPVAVGIETHPGQGPLSLARWAARQPDRPHPAAVDFLLGQIREHPGAITLIAIGPLTNLGAAIQRDPATFRKLKRIVIMGGSVRSGYGSPDHAPDAEYNLKMDIPAAQAVFTSGVPLYVLPLDSTQIALNEARRRLLFADSTNLTDAMALLYDQWSFAHNQADPTMFDAVAVAYAIDPEQCPMTPLRLEVDGSGFTREVKGEPNTFVCLKSNEGKFYDFYMPRILKQALGGACTLAPVK